MATVEEASCLLKDLASPWGVNGEKTKAAISRAGRLAKLAYWRAFDIWYVKARRVEDFEFQQIRDALREKNERAARNELHDLKARLAILESRLAQGDADFYRPHIDLVRANLRKRS